MFFIQDKNFSRIRIPAVTQVFASHCRQRTNPNLDYVNGSFGWVCTRGQTHHRLHVACSWMETLGIWYEGETDLTHEEIYQRFRRAFYPAYHIPTFRELTRQATRF